jgi:glutaminyl-tRNA synthetase
MGVFDPIKLVITNWSGGVEMMEVENNPEIPESGVRLVPFSGELFIEREDFKEEANSKYHRLKLGGEVRLKGAYIVKTHEVVKDDDGNVVEVRCTYDPNTRSGMVVDRKVKGVIHWVSCESAVSMLVNEYDRLFSHPEPDKSNEDLISLLNPDSLTINENAKFEPEALNMRVGVPVQMMRKGYYVMDPSGALNRTVGLKDSWADRS